MGSIGKENAPLLPNKTWQPQGAGDHHGMALRTPPLLPAIRISKLPCTPHLPADGLTQPPHAPRVPGLQLSMDR